MSNLHKLISNKPLIINYGRSDYQMFSYFLLISSCQLRQNCQLEMRKEWRHRLVRLSHTLTALTYFSINHPRLKWGFLFETMINVSVMFSLFIWIPMLWVYGHYKRFNSLIHIIRSCDCTTTTWDILCDCATTTWGMSCDCTTITWGMSCDCATTTWGMSCDCATTTWDMSCDCTTITWGMSCDCATTTWGMSCDCATTTWGMSCDCTTITWGMSCDCATTTWDMSCDCATTTWGMSCDCAITMWDMSCDGATTTWGMSCDCTTTTLGMSCDCATTTWDMSCDCAITTWGMSCDCATTTWDMSCDCATITWDMPCDCATTTWDMSRDCATTTSCDSIRTTTKWGMSRDCATEPSLLVICPIAFPDGWTPVRNAPIIWLNQGAVSGSMECPRDRCGPCLMGVYPRLLTWFTGVVSMSGQRRRRWPSIETTLYQRLASFFQVFSLAEQECHQILRCQVLIGFTAGRLLPHSPGFTTRRMLPHSPQIISRQFCPVERLASTNKPPFTF